MCCLPKKGLFIVFEGIDACGKSTMLTRSAKYLFKNFKKCDSIFVTREPTNSSTGQAIRKMLKTHSSPLTSSKELLRLYLEDRKDHLDNFIKPLYNKQAIILCDRYKYSTIAYQHTQGIPLNKVIELHKNMLVPDLVLIFDVSPKESLNRIAASREAVEKFEKESFLEELRENYLKLKELLPKENIKIIKANKSKKEVFSEVKFELNKLMKEKKI